MAAPAAPPPEAETLSCIVSPEWALAVAGVNTGHLQGTLARPDLWQEFQLLEKLLYKNANQHCGAQHFQRLQEIRRLLRLLKDVQLDRRVQAFHEAFHASKQKGTLPTGSVLLAYGGDQRRVPSHEAAVAVLHSLRAACQLVEQLAPAVHRTSLQLLAQLAHSFFMPLCLTSLSALARIQVLSGQLLLDAVKAYNMLAEAAALLPSSPTAAAAAAELATEDATMAAGGGGREQAQRLPQMLRAHWRGGLPKLESLPCPEGESLGAQAAATCARYAVQVVQPEPETTAVVLEEAVPRRQAAGRRQRGQPAAPVLAVVEDRGVPISREAFAAAAASVTVAAAAAAGGAEEAADWEEELAEDARPAAAAAAAAAGAAAAGAAAAAEPLLLGVVEESVIEEDPAGVVCSLMEGEAIGHLYRRSTAGLGGAKRAPKPSQLLPVSMLPASPPAVAAAAAAAAAAADEGPSSAALPALAEHTAAAPAVAAKPAFTSVTAAAAPMQAAAAAPKPAFLSVSAPAARAVGAGAPMAPKPAFLSVAAPAPKSTVASTSKPAVAAAAEAPAAAAAAATVAAALAAEPAAAAPPLALSSAAARKRKKPAAAAAGAAAAEQQAAAAAAAPKSWEDWLQPLGGAPATATEAAASRQQPPGGRGQQGGKRRRGK